MEIRNQGKKKKNGQHENIRQNKVLTFQFHKPP